MPENIAKRWVPGDGPVEIEPLGSGLVNRSYRVTRAGRQFALRLDTADSGALGLDRRWECRIRAHAAAAGLAAAVHVCDPVHGVLVADWVTGRCWTLEETQLPDNIDAMARLLRRLHALAIPQPARRMSPGAWIAHYTAALERHESAAPSHREELRAAAAMRLAALGPAMSDAVCHGDLHRLNVIVRDRPVLLDWEYAHVSEPLWDVAGWVANNDWPAAAAERFLASYLEGRVRREDTIRLEHLGWLYDYVCILWSELPAQQRPGHPGEALRARASELSKRLARVR